MNNYIRILLIVVFFSSCSKLDTREYDSSSLLEEISVDQNYLNKNYVGMTKKQIIYMFGMPIISDPFHDVYHYHIYNEVRKNIFEKEILSLYFKYNKVFLYNIKKC